MTYEEMKDHVMATVTPEQMERANYLVAHPEELAAMLNADVELEARRKPMRDQIFGLRLQMHKALQNDDWKLYEELKPQLAKVQQEEEAL